VTQRLRSFLLLFVFPLGIASSACDCGGKPKPPEENPGECQDATDGSECTGGLCCGEVCIALDSSCDPGYECAGDAVCTEDGVSCGNCQPLPPLNKGRMADDLDSTVQADGTYVLSGYSPGVPDGNDLYGDLVVGTYDSSSQVVSWEIVDGVPTSGDIEGDPNDWRGGVTTPGPNVGRYTSVEAIGDDLIVAYADVDNGSLKVATRVDGAWATYVIDEGGAMVAWTSMAVDNLGIPVISYAVYRKPNLEAGEDQPQASLRIARPNTPLPGVGLGDAGLPPPADPDAGIVDLGNGWQWTITELGFGGSEPTADMKCIRSLCADGYECITSEAGICVLPTQDCGGGDPDAGIASSCASSSPVCLDGTCYQRKRASDYLSSPAMYTDIERTSTGLALVYYDRTAGNVVGRTCAADPCDDAEDWGAPFVIDGWSLARTHAGDCGIGASLAVDASDTWHVTYVDGTWEELRYAVVVGGAVVSYETVDDGTAGLTGLPRNQVDIVGDDSSVVAVDVGTGIEIRVAYVDVTEHVTVLAVRSPDTGAWAYELLSPSNPDGQAYASVTAAPASGLVSYVGAQWLVMAMESTDDVFLSDTDVFTLGLPPAPDGGVGDAGL
jgi:hypothetical protein